MMGAKNVAINIVREETSKQCLKVSEKASAKAFMQRSWDKKPSISIHTIQANRGAYT